MPITSVYNFGDNPTNIKGSKTVITPDSNPLSQRGNSSDTVPSSPTTNGASGLSATRESVGRVLAQQSE